MTDEHVYGVRARVNAGLGLWQMAYASKAPLTAVNYAAARAYRYISPSFYLNKKTERVVAINGAGLVHVPALNLVALARPGDDQNGDDTETITARFAAAPGLDADADATEILDAIASSKTTDPARHVPIDALRDMQATTPAMIERKVQDKVGAAVTGGYITPAMRERALDLCRSDPASFDTFIASQPPAWGHLGTMQRDGKEPPTVRPETDLEIAMCRQLGLAPGRPRERDGSLRDLKPPVRDPTGGARVQRAHSRLKFRASGFACPPGAPAFAQPRPAPLGL